MFELWRKSRQLAKANKSYDAEIEKARKEKKSSDEIASLEYGLEWDIRFIEEQIKVLVSRNLVKKAESLLLPVSAEWKKGEMTGLHYLTPNGIMKLRNLIREEKAAQRKAVLEWVGPFIGIIGAVTGLLAVILTMT